MNATETTAVHEFVTASNATVSIAPDPNGTQPNALVIRTPNPTPGTHNLRTAVLPLSREDVANLRAMLDHYDEDHAR